LPLTLTKANSYFDWGNTRKLLRMFGEKRFGLPDAETAAALEAIEEVARLEELCDRLLSVESWRELLEHSSPRGRKGRRRSSS
jgi:hypothetical protein